MVPDPGCSQNPTEAALKGQWVKSGIEFVDDAPKVGTVACDRFADWSLVTEGIVPASSGGTNATQVTIEMERRPVDDTLVRTWEPCFILFSLFRVSNVSRYMSCTFSCTFSCPFLKQI